MPRKKVDCVNETRKMNNGMKATCIAYRQSKDMDIQFEDGTIIEHVQKVHFYKGNIINPHSSYNPHQKLESLSATNPELLDEWDYEKNQIDPDSITRSYRDKIWWKCKNGHSWQTVISARTRKKGTHCPYCAGNLPVEGLTDFATTNPELMLDWNFSRNKDIDPKKITAHSGVYVDWKCHFCGHEWRTSVNNRSTLKRGCPNCSMKSTSFGEQAVYYYVKKIFPDAINRYRESRFELDIYIPSIKTAIEFDGAFFHRDKASDQRETRKYNKCRDKGIKLIRIKDSSAMEGRWNSDYTIGVENLQDHRSLNNVIRLLLKDLDSQSNCLFRKNPIQIWSTIDSDIDVDKDYFEIVSNKYIRAKEDSFVSANPELLKDWDYDLNGNVNPQAITKGSTMIINWKCHVCGFRWKSRIADRLRGTGCPCCNKNVLVKGVNDFATLYPDELKEWDYEKNDINPGEVITYGVKIAWKCSKCGHRWTATITDKVIRKDKTGCPECGRKSVASKRHQRAMVNGGLFERYPELLASWNYERNKDINPLDISAGSPKRYWWKCPDCTYEWESSPNNRTHGGRVRGCPKCRYKNG